MKLARQANFDVALLDLTLPDSSGRETFLRARAEAPALPIVVMTSVDDEALGLEAVATASRTTSSKGRRTGGKPPVPSATPSSASGAKKRFEQAEAALQQERDKLEEKVGERTAELSALNRLLQAEILQRQTAEEANRLVLRRLSEAQETERGRISRELHDRLGQDLTALKLGLGNLRRQGPLPRPWESISQAGEAGGRPDARHPPAGLGTPALGAGRPGPGPGLAALRRRMVPEHRGAGGLAYRRRLGNPPASATNLKPPFTALPRKR